MSNFRNSCLLCELLGEPDSVTFLAKDVATNRPIQITMSKKVFKRFLKQTKDQVTKST